MSGVAVVASRDDARFARAVLAWLPGSEAREICPASSLARLVASGDVVLLVWSAALEKEAHDAGAIVDVVALTQLWSEDRLVIARRDECLLPLGMRDVGAFDPEVESETIGLALRDRRLAIESDQEPVVRFSRAASREAPMASRGGSHDDEQAEAVFMGRKPPAPVEGKSSKAIVAFVVLAALGVAGGVWYYLGVAERARIGTVQETFEEAVAATSALKDAQAKLLEAMKAVENARAEAAAALKAGDTAKAKLLEERARRAEAETAKQAEIVKQHEVAAIAARENARKAKAQADSLPQAKGEKKSAEIAAVTPTVTASTPTKPSAAAPAKGAATTIAIQEPAKDTVPQISRREREELDAEAKRQEARMAKAREAGKTGVVALDPMAEARALEAEGKYREAVRVYRLAARKGSGPAAKRLGEIYDRGVPGVNRDLAESLQWYEAARLAGENVPSARYRGSAPGTAVARPAVVEAPKPAVAEAPKPVAVEPPKPAVVEAPKPAPEPTPTPAPRSRWIFTVLILLLALGTALYLWRRRPTPRPTPRAIGDAAAPAFPRGAPASTLFVSYSHKDKTRVEPIISLIEGMGRQVWLDRVSITGQAGWAGQIVRAIRECRAVVLMASPNSYSSDQVVRELYLAMNHKKPIVPIEIEPAELPDELQYILAPFQHHKLSGGETREVLGRALAAI